MTKFILVGGYPRRAADGGKGLAQEMVKGFKEPIKMLICYFARPTIQWKLNAVEDRQCFRKHLVGKKVEFKTAQIENFSEQVNWANVIYLRGGRTEKLLKLLGQCGDWEKELSGKTIAGSSAGAHALSKYNFNLDKLKLDEGIGLVPVKVLVHYQSNYNAPNIDWNEALEELKNYKENLPTYTLREGEYVILEK